MMFLLWPIIALSIVVSACFAGYFQGHTHGAQEIQAKWDTEKAATVIAQRDKEALLQAGMDKLRTEKNRETAKLRSTVAALAERLRNRPERPDVPASASAGDGATGCTGAELYRQDSQFLISEAARADTIRIALKACQDAYRAAQ